MVQAVRYDTSTLPLARSNELFGYRSPALTDKLLHLRVVTQRQEATSLFVEVIRYLVITELHAAELVPMFSRRVDEVWHQFVLFTEEYERFCRRFFGKFMHHEPNEATTVAGGAGDEPAANEMTFPRFREVYEGLFGPISSAWYDDRAVAASTRVRLGRWRRPLALRTRDGMAEVAVLRDPPVVLCRTGLVAEPALRLLMSGESFHVRELPGLDEEEKIALCRTLVQARVLQVAP